MASVTMNLKTELKHYFIQSTNTLIDKHIMDWYLENYFCHSANCVIPILMLINKIATMTKAKSDGNCK